MDEKFSAGGNSPKKTQSTLWEFALAAYAEPIIQRHCLYLQDHYQMDVNMLLAAGFCSHQGRGWTDLLCRELIALAAPIREEYILPLRAMRRQAEGGGGLYNALKAAELEAERMEIEVLAKRIAAITATAESDVNYLDAVLSYAALYADVRQGDVLGKCVEMAANFAEIS